MRRTLIPVAVATAAVIALSACSGTAPTGGSTTTSSDGGSTTEAGEAGQDITLWLMGGDTPDELREYLKTTYAANTGGSLTIEEQSWSDALSKLTTALPDAANTPDVVEIGNTWSATFTSVGAFTDVTDMVEELGGDNLLQSFVDAGKFDGANYALPYYFGSRYMFYRKDIWSAAGKTVPTTLEEFNATAAELSTDTQSGFYLGGEDWRNGISWIFANGGELAVEKDGE